MYFYQKSDLKIVFNSGRDSRFRNGEDVDFHLEHNVIPNFGGTADDYGYIETDEQYFHLELINDEVVIVKENRELLDLLNPSPEEIEQAEFELKTLNILMEVGLL